MQLGATDIKNLTGLFDKFVGLWKEVVGEVIGNERLQREGEAQQEKATESLKALRDQAKADAQRTKAKVIGSAQGEGEGHGVFTEVKGKAKQVAGDAFGDREMSQEGRADQERGRAGRQATKAEASAKSHEAKSRASEMAENLASNGR